MAKSIKQLKAEYTQLLEAMNDNLRRQVDVLVSTPNYLGQGAVYIVRQVGTDNYKIGHTTNYDQRRYQFDVRLPFEITEVFIYRTEHYRTIEQRVHELLKPHRLNRSEFFELTEKQVEEVTEAIQNEHVKIIEESSAITPIQEIQEERPDGDADLMNQVLGYMNDMGIPKTALSTSSIQRKFKVGYSRAARIKDRILEEVEC